MKLGEEKIGGTAIWTGKHINVLKGLPDSKPGKNSKEGKKN